MTIETRIRSNNNSSGTGSGSASVTSANSTIRTITQAAHGFSVGSVVRLTGGTYAFAQANNAVNAEAVGLVTVVADTNTFVLLTEGYFSTLTNLTAGSVYFLSDTTSGSLTQTSPTNTDTVVKPLVVAESNSSGYFFNMRGDILGSATNRQQIYNWFAGQLMITESAPASTELLTGTTVKSYGDYYDQSVQEYRNGVYYVPNDLDTTASVNFQICWIAKSAQGSIQAVVWQVENCPIADNEVFDATYIVTTAGAANASTTPNVIQRTTFTTPVSTLGWATNDTVFFRFSRLAANTADTLVSDAAVVNYTIRIPLS